MLAQRAKMERWTAHVEAFGIRIFIEPLADKTLILALGSLSDVGAETGWLLFGFDFTALLKQQVSPLLSTFGNREKGRVIMLQPDDTWNETAIQTPLNRILPGYFLSFQPTHENDDNGFVIHKVLLLSLSLAVLLAFGLAILHRAIIFDLT